MSNIKAIKLVTGEDVVCEYITMEDEDIAVLKNPVQVSLVPSRAGGQPNFGFIPFPLTSNDKEIIINKTSIVFVCTPAEEFITQYNSIFGAGIITPTQGIIV